MKKKRSCLKDLENYSKGDFTDLKSKSFHGLACPGPRELQEASLLRMTTLHCVSVADYIYPRSAHSF